MRCRRRWWRDDRGVAIGPEVVILLVAMLVLWGFLSWLGRLNSTSQNISNTAQSAARAAAMEPDPASGRAAAQQAVATSSLAGPCVSPASTAMSWRPGEDGTWLGGSVTVEVSCRVDNTGPFSANGNLVTAEYTQPIEPFLAAP